MAGRLGKKRLQINNWKINAEYEEVKKKGSKIFQKILFFQKCSNFFDIMLGILGPDWGCLFASIKVWGSLTYSLKNSWKNNWKIAVFRLKTAYSPSTREKRYIRTVFCDFSSECVSEPQAFIEAKAHPQAGPETPNIMSKNFQHFWNKRFFKNFLTFFTALTPPCVRHWYYMVLSAPNT